MESAIYIVATPIGNLSDISYRAIDVLKSVGLVAAEDTRHTRRLLEHYCITTKMISIHEHNEAERAKYIIDQVLEGKSVALVSDAGTPLISDPGHILVREAKKAGVKVIPVPGASAIIAALCSSGIACGKFVFEGFLPAKRKAKTEALDCYLEEQKTVVFYESPHRIVDTLEVMQDVFGAERQVAVARELTKKFETIHSDSLQGVLDWMKEDENQQRGEFVLVLSGSDSLPEEADVVDKKKMLARLLIDLPPKKASAIVADILGGSKKEAYNLALELK